MSGSFSYRNGVFQAEAVSLLEIAERFGTPCYVYSRAAIEAQWQAYDQAFHSQPHLICYAVKANSNLAVLQLLARLGSSFDIVSIGELERVIKAGGDVKKVVFSGVGKTQGEMRQALEYGVKSFNVESLAEITRLNQVAESLGKIAPVSLRVNPDVDANTHPYISTGLKENKFGIAFDEAKAAYLEASDLSHLEIIGIDCHIGSQITEISPFVDALKRLLVLIGELEQEGIQLKHIDVGGGLGIRYEQEDVPEMGEYADAILQLLSNSDYEIILEPGRSIIGNAGILLTRVEYLKPTTEHHFAIVDAAMNDLLRPALYSAYHDILPVNEDSEAKQESYEIVGPICETGDFLGKSRQLALNPGDLLAVCSAGAYGFTMSSNYNSRPRVAEIMVDGDQVHLIRRRETIDDLFEHEMLLPE